MEDVLALAADLERRYQAPVNLGHLERRLAVRVLETPADRWPGGIPEIPEGVRVG